MVREKREREQKRKTEDLEDELEWKRCLSFVFLPFALFYILR